MRRSLTDAPRANRAADSAAVILNGLACGDFACECPNSVSRGRGMVHCPVHDADRSGEPDLNVELGDNNTVLVHCHVGCPQHAVLAALRELGLWGRDPNRTGYADMALATAREQSGKPLGQKVAEYVYTDRDGTPLFVVERYDPKDFRQRLADGTRRGVSDAWTLYRLPAVIAAVARKETIYIAEGEKDVEALEGLGFVATTSPGGAGKWDDRYSEFLIGANVVVCQDRDELNQKTGKRAGLEHIRDVAQSLSIGARTVKILEFPNAHDAADWVKAGGTKMLLDTIVDDLPEWQSSEKVIYTARDLAVEFRDVMAKRKAGDPESVGWPIGFRTLDREMVYSPGDLIVIAGTAGIGKTTFLQTLERRSTVPTLFFSVEMSRQQLMNRRMAALTGLDSWKIRRGALSETEYAQIMAEVDAFERDDDHNIVDNPSLTTDALESILRISRIRFGTRVAYVDYLQRLADKSGEGEYERVSGVAKALARIARETGTSIVAAAQVNRKGDRVSGEPPFKSEIRDSGVIEQEAAIILAIGRAEGATATKLAVRKNRHGIDGFTVDLEFDLMRSQFVEKGEARVSGQRAPQEVPF